MIPPETFEFGFGALVEQPDPRDYDVAELYAALDLAAMVPPIAKEAAYPPPVYNQGGTPRCVTYAAAAEKNQQDRLDMGAFFPPDFALFAAQIGTTAQGASMRNALDKLVSSGFPEVSGNAGHHRITSYYLVPVTEADIKAAILSDNGGVLVIGPWAHAWWRPGPSGILAPFDYDTGWHATWFYGWDDAKGWFTGRNSWGAAWGDGGDYHLPYARLTDYVKFAWKTSDVVEWVRRKVVCGGGRYRAKPTTGARAFGATKAGDVAMVRAGAGVPGSSWTACGKTGNRWHVIRNVNGVTTKRLWGVPVVYSPAGRWS